MKIHTFANETFEQGENVICPICGIVRNANTSGAFRWTMRTLERRGFVKHMFNPTWNDGCMFALPRKIFLPICFDRAACERRMKKNAAVERILKQP